jgi:sulfite reductase (NADPH) flavoprotein alpha-component
MISEAKLHELVKIGSQFSKEELIWASGYFAGLAGVSSDTAIANGAGAKPAVGKISIVFGTETGNSKKLANQLAAQAKKKGIQAKIAAMEQYKIADLSKEEYFFVITSTHGEGEPPIAAKKFYDHIHSEKLDLSKMKYSVLALGDSSYPQFCQTGVDVDAQLNKLGAKAIVPVQLADVEFQAPAEAWFQAVVSELSTNGSSATKSVPAVSIAPSSGKKFYEGIISAHINLNDIGSNKETYHVEITCDESIDYLPGDAFGILPVNDEATVQKILSITGADASKIVKVGKEEGPLGNMLKNAINLRYLSPNLVKKYAEIVGESIPETRIDLVDLLQIYPVKDANQFHEVIAVMLPIAPRLYSISSSPSAHEGEIHITVSLNTFKTENDIKYGLCSDYISKLTEGTKLTFYISKNSSFKLPAEDKDIILIGPGTGLAPMRSFISERDATGSSGRTWLIFGEQHLSTDFLYQTEIQSYIETGVLTKFNSAFSRDQAEKIYVQNRIIEHGAEFYTWLDNGATVYLSGTKDPMSYDVDKAILEIIKTHGKKSDADAQAYFDALIENDKYLKDVY